MYNRANYSVLRYWQQRKKLQDLEDLPEMSVPGVHRGQVPGDEMGLARQFKVNSRRSNLHLGFEPTPKDRAENDDEVITVNEPSSYRGRPKSGRQWG